MKSDEMKVLVVDDSSMVRRIIRTELENGGYRVTEASNGIEALAHSSLSIPPDLITLDIEMPKMNGFETCRKLREKRYAKAFSKYKGNHVPVIFITGNDTLEDRKKGFMLGAADFITKPFANGEILAAINKILKPDNRLRGMTALVVDDNVTARHIVREVLRREGLTVIEACDGIEAFEIMCKRMADIDIVISDFVMPRLEGEALCRKIRTELKLDDIPIIILTAMSDQSELLKLFKAGATDYLIKPFVKEELLARLSVQLERTQLYKRLKESVDKLKELNKMKDELLAVCSHDLRTPLNGILGFADDLLEKNYLLNEDREGLTYIKKSGDFLMNLINDILDLSKIQAEKAPLTLEPVSANELVSACVNSLKHQSTQKNQLLTLQTKINDDLISANRSGLTRVINNLLSNAMKFTPEKGKITVIIDDDDDGMLTIAVQDTGIGIPEDKIPFLFDKFTKTSQSGTSGEKGTGLGMSIIKEMIERHRGYVKVDSQVNVGTCFTVYLPKLDSSDALNKSDQNEKQDSQEPDTQDSPSTTAFDEKKSQPQDDWLKNCRILLAEDNEVQQQLAKRMFAKSNVDLDIVSNGDEAISKLKNQAYHAVLMDMHMPVLDGIEATKCIRAESQFKSLPIIAMTASFQKIDHQKCLNAGMNDCVIKPIKREKILEVLRKWIPQDAFTEDIPLKQSFQSEINMNESDQTIKSEIKINDSVHILPLEDGTSYDKQQFKQDHASNQKTILPKTINSLPLTKRNNDEKIVRPGISNQSSRPSNQSSPINILLVDDNPVNVLYARMVVTNAGYSATVVDNGQDAIDAVRRSHFDIILMDVNMPVLNGIEATIEIRRAIKEQIPIIALTANATQENFDSCIAAGMNDVITKPFKPTQLLNIIQQYIQKPSEIINSNNEDTMNNNDIFNKQAALEFLEGDHELLVNILKGFIQDTPDQIMGIKEGVKNANSTKIILHAHSLKSTSTTIGAFQMMKIAQLIEEIGNQGDIQKAASHIPDLENAYSLLINEIQDSM